MLHLVQLATSKEAIAFYALVLAGLEKKFQFIKPGVKWVENHKGIVVDALKEAAVVGEDILNSPQAAGLKLELTHAKNQVEQSLIFKGATAVLNNLSTKLEDMDKDQKNVTAVAIVSQVDKLFGVQVTASQVLGVLDEIKSLNAKVAPEPSVKGAEQITKPVESVPDAPDPTPAAPETPKQSA